MSLFESDNPLWGFVVLFLVAPLIGLWGCSVNSGLPDPGALKTAYPVVSYHGKDKPFTISLQKTRPPGWVAVGDISKVGAGAIIVSEDWAFYQHKGYDPNQIREVIETGIEKGGFTRGASTITQQVVKNVFLTSDRTLARKVKELFLATRMEESIGKRRILEVYLNIAEWGEGIFGIGAAARHYFNKHPRELTAKEGAFLAMLLPSPKRYSQSYRQKTLTPYARKTVNSILSKMTQAHYLTPEEREAEEAKPLSFEISVTPGQELDLRDASEGES